MDNKSIIRELFFWISPNKKKELIDKINKALNKIDTSSNATEVQNSKDFLKDVTNITQPQKSKEKKNTRIKKILGKNSIYSWIYK